MKSVQTIYGVFDTDLGRLVGIAPQGVSDVTFLAGQDTQTVGDPVTAKVNPLTGGVEISGCGGLSSLPGKIPNDIEMLFYRPVGERVSVAVPNPYAAAPIYVIHPSVVFIPGGLSGYKYWMAYTPMNNNDSQYENPCICASNDGITWELPAGCPNPIFPSLGGSTYNRDPHLLFKDGVLILVHSTRNEAGKNRIKISTSTNGISWSAYSVIWEGVTGTSDVASPSLWYDDALSKWVIVGHNVDDAGRAFRKITSSNLLSGWDTAPVAVTFPAPTGRKWWHSCFTCLSSGRIVGVAQDNAGDSSSGNLYVAESLDGITFTSARLSVETSLWYRTSAFFVETNGSVEAYIYSSALYSNSFARQKIKDVKESSAIVESQNLAMVIAAAKSGPDRNILSADDFTRADSAVSLGSTLDGKVWTQYLSNYMGIQGNSAYNTVAGNCRPTIDCGVNSYSVSVIFAQVLTGCSAFLICNFLDDTHLWRIGAVSQVLTIQRVNGTVDVNLSFNPDFVMSGDIIRADVSGTSIRFFKNGRLIYTANQTGFVTPTGVCGIQASTAVVTKFKSFGVRSLS